jgi:hypothetical protein
MRAGCCARGRRRSVRAIFAACNAVADARNDVTARIGGGGAITVIVKVHTAGALQRVGGGAGF